MIIEFYHYQKLFYSLAFILLFPFICQAQDTIKGKVTDKDGSPLAYVSVESLKDSLVYQTDSLGIFTIPVKDLTPVKAQFSLLGYKVFIKEILPKRENVIVMIEESNLIEEISIIRPYKEYTAVSLSKFDIYTNPNANADALNAIQIYPYSTNVDETANPSFRGSEADKSKVFINGVPINNPVRNSQINGVGNFSILNTELVESMDVYPGNPPLNYGNSSAGLMDIKTARKVNDNLQIQLSLAGIGGMVNRNIGENSFIQIYGNHQFSKPFLKVNQKAMAFLRDFKNSDFGVNFRTNFSNKGFFNIYGYFLSEDSELISSINFNKGINYPSKQRAFAIANIFSPLSDHFSLQAHTGIDFNNQNFLFNTIDANTKFNFFYSSSKITYRKNNLLLESGLELQILKSELKGTYPFFYYDNQENSLKDSISQAISNPLLESFLIGSYQLEKFKFSIGLRKDIPLAGNSYSSDYLSYQSMVKWNLDDKNHFQLAAGKYHNISEPNFLYFRQNLQSSDQLSIEYIYNSKNFKLNLASYIKHENGLSNNSYEFLEGNVNKRKIVGAELGIEWQLLPSIKWITSFSRLRSEIILDNESYLGSNNLPYFIKNAAVYSKKRWSLSLASLNRTGTRFTKVIGGNLRPDINSYEPIYDIVFNNNQLSSYNRVDFSISKLIPINGNVLTTYFSVNNILNTHNERNVIYNHNFTNNEFEYFNGRFFYFGTVFTLNN